MKRYLLFICSEYYPSGGFNDFYCDGDNLENLKSEAELIISGKTGISCADFYHIIDTTTMKEIANGV